MTQPQQWTMFAHRLTGHNGTFYMNFGEKWWVEIHGFDDPVVCVQVTEQPDGQYYGWIEAGETDPEMIQPDFSMFDIQFTYGVQAEVKRQKGRIIRLSVTEIPAPPQPATWQLWAHEVPSKTGVVYMNMGAYRSVKFYGLSYPIVKVELTEDPAGQYWGWIKRGADTPTLFGYSEGMFNLNFPYGYQAEVAEGRGTAVRLTLRVISREEPT